MDTQKRPRGRPRKYPIPEQGEQPEVIETKETPMATDTETNRPPLRPDMRAEDSRAEAARRAEEILENFKDDAILGGDEFTAPAPYPGWSYEWKTKSVLNQENYSYQVALAQAGWTPVPLSRHPEMMPTGWHGTVIERKGMLLMERPAVISDRVRRLEMQKAREQVRAKEEQMHGAPQGHFDRRKSDGSPVSSVKKGFEPLQIPD